MYTALINYCKENNVRCLVNEPLYKHTTFRIGGNADVFVYANSSETLSRILKILNENTIPFMIIGKGSNLLVNDNGVKGVVVSLEEMKNITLTGDVITAQSGAHLISLCTFAAENSLKGLEFAYGIPASVGGALYMNAGAYGGEMKDVVIGALCITENGETVYINAKDMALAYRSSIFKKENYIILSVDFKLCKGEKDIILKEMNDYFSRRKEKQPLEYGSAGSTFKRPEGYFAGALIEQNGLKGESVGGAQVSEKHAGFIINKNGATCGDVLSLIEKVKQTVLKNNGVELEREVILINEDLSKS